MIERVAQNTLKPAGDGILTAINGAAANTAGSSDVNWFSLLALLFCGVGLLMLAASLVGASAWYGSGAERRTWARRHLAYGVVFSSLTILAGLVLQALSLFQSLPFGPEVVAILAGLPVLLVVYLFAADTFCEHRAPLYLQSAHGSGERLEDLLSQRRTLHHPLPAETVEAGDTIALEANGATA